MVILLPLSILAHLQVKKDNLDRAVALVTAVWYVICLGMIIVGDRLYGVLIVTATMPVLHGFTLCVAVDVQSVDAGLHALIVVGSITRLTVSFYTLGGTGHIIADVESFR